jgi:hypothetical protein
LAHPAVFLNDEFITTNQLRQLHAGHQIIVNEGKYGLIENGSMSRYFSYKSNLLAYSLFLPLVSMPAYWLIDLTGEQIAYVILILVTSIAFILLLFINHFFPNFSYVGKWRWTPLMAAVTIVIFFINLYYYSPFSVDVAEDFPEILAIVLTNIFLLAISAMLIYEINRTIFEDPLFSFFGTIVCLTSSSYFFWTTHCKDHILVLTCFVPIVLSLVYFFKKDEYWYLPLAFLFCGLLAWERPELAFWIFLLLCTLCGYIFKNYHSQSRSFFSQLALVISPIFTLIGALPFFLNNLLMTKNIFLPVLSLYLNDESTAVTTNVTQSLSLTTGANSLHPIITMVIPSFSHSPEVIIRDIAGILFLPQTGYLGVFSIVPFFFVMFFLAGTLYPLKKICFNSEEKRILILLSLVSVTVFIAYMRQIHLLNTDFGIVPDMRYLSPLYFCLTLIGLILMKKIALFEENPEKLIKYFFRLLIIGVPISIVSLSYMYTLNMEILKSGHIPIEKFFSLYILSLMIVILIVSLYCIFRNCYKQIMIFLMLILCSVPFFWQVNQIFVSATFSGYAGYIFWIPVMRIFWAFLLAMIF